MNYTPSNNWTILFYPNQEPIVSDNYANENLSWYITSLDSTGSNFDSDYVLNYIKTELLTSK